MKNLLIQLMAMIVFAAIDTAKNLLLLIYYITPGPDDDVDASIYMGTVIGLMSFCFWTIAILNKGVTMPDLVPKILIILVAVGLPLQYQTTSDPILLCNEIVGGLSGILFAVLGYKYATSILPTET